MSKALSGLNPSKSKWRLMMNRWKKMTVAQLREEYDGEGSRHVRSLIRVELQNRGFDPETENEKVK